MSPVGTRPFVLLLLGVAVVLSGCTEDPPSSGGGSGDDDDDAAPGPFADITPGVDQAVRAAPSTPAITGFVYDVDSGRAVSGAQVTANCVRGALPATSETILTSASGAFGFAAQPSLMGCAALEYEVTAGDYTLAVPLRSPPIVDGVQYIVHAGMIPAP